jgi:hypothetical protein
MKRNFDSVAQMKAQEDSMEREGLVPPIDRSAIFSWPTALNHEKLPPNSGPRYPRAKPPRPALPGQKNG